MKSIKKIFTICAIFAMTIMMTLSSCRKEGPEGPQGVQGIQGAQGPAGNPNIQVIQFSLSANDLETGQTFPNSTAIYKHPIPQITQDVIANGAVVCYRSSGGLWFQMPANANGHEYRFALGEGNCYFRIRKENGNQFTNVSDATNSNIVPSSFKIVIIPN